MAKKVIVVGGGSGGLVAARMVQTESTRLGADLDVTLISASEKHYMPPLWSEVALGTASPEETWAPIKNAEKAYGFKVVVDPVKTFDLKGRKVVTEGGQTYDYDFLVIALGTAYGWGDYKGLDTYGFHNYTEEGALELKRELAHFKGKKIVFLVPELPFRCGIYPPEMAMNVRAYFEPRGLHPEITVLYPADAIRMALGEGLDRFFRRRFKRTGIRYVNNFEQLIEVTENKVVTKNGEFEYDLLIKAPPSRLPKVLADNGLAHPGDPRWSVVSGPRFQHPEHPEVYLVGEHAMPPVGLLTAGVPIHNAAVIAGASILNDALGGYMIPSYGDTLCMGHSFESGFAGNCEYWWIPEEGKWGHACYTVATGPMVRLMKDSFYRGWLDALR
jgi:sulfide:quinone oxidoreductase